ncbi:MAG: alpha/beta fold hydrolase [Ginsengibacter sp.]
MEAGKVNLAGNSYGAYTALLTAVYHPELVNALVLNEPPVLPLLVSNFNNPLQILSLFIRDFKTAKNLMEFGLQHMKPAAKALKENQMEKGVRLFADGALGKGGFDKIPEEAKKTFIDNASALKAELLGPGFPPSFPIGKAKQLNVPVLFVYGQNSPQFLYSISDKLMKMLPNCEKVIIPNASHLTHGENPIAYNEKVLQFLLKHPVNAGK